MIARIEVQLPEDMKQEFLSNVKDEASTLSGKLKQLIFQYNKERKKRGKTNDNANEA